MTLMWGIIGWVVCGVLSALMLLLVHRLRYGCVVASRAEALAALLVCEFFGPAAFVVILLILFCNTLEYLWDHVDFSFLYPVKRRVTDWLDKPLLPEKYR